VEPRERGRRMSAHHPNVGLRSTPLQLGDDGRQEMVARRLRRPDPDHPAATVAVLGEHALHLFELLEHLPCELEQDLTRRRRARAAGAAYEERDADLFLERADLLADCGLAQVELLASTCEAANLDDRLEDAELLRLEHVLFRKRANRMPARRRGFERMMPPIRGLVPTQTRCCPTKRQGCALETVIGAHPRYGPRDVGIGGPLPHVPPLGAPACSLAHP